jgi:hypothetical protein
MGHLQAEKILNLHGTDTLIFWPRLGIRLPGHLPALLAGCAVMLVVNLLGGGKAGARHIPGQHQLRQQLRNAVALSAVRQLIVKLPALLAGCAVMLVVNLLGGDVATIGSQFHYQLAGRQQRLQRSPAQGKAGARHIPGQHQLRQQLRNAVAL